jgi:hypothetical protein
LKAVGLVGVGGVVVLVLGALFLHGCRSVWDRFGRWFILSFPFL